MAVNKKITDALLPLQTFILSIFYSNFGDFGDPKVT